MRKPRNFSYAGTSVTVMPGVFHPGLFYSSRFLIEHILQKPLRNVSLLELGCGAGLLSILAAKKGAIVTAIDLSTKAIENVSANNKANGTNLTILNSDLFDRVPQHLFDYIAINPPYYPRDAATEADLAWNAGASFHYFKKLFSSLDQYAGPSTEVIMVLTQGTDLARIFSIAAKANYYFEVIQEKWMLFDGKDFLYRIRKGRTGMAMATESAS